MSKTTMALAAVLLAGGIGAASAQGQTQTQGQAQVQMPGQGRSGSRAGADDAHPTASRRVTPRRWSRMSAAQINPSAAGTVRGRGQRPRRKRNAGEDDGEHSGSVGQQRQYAPAEIAEARGKPRQEGMTEPSGVYPTPQLDNEP